ncbi:cytochrome P450 [Rhizoctonia solani]|nr:cytochrome P450 [Rhizoctonia solani]
MRSSATHHILTSLQEHYPTICLTSSLALALLWTLKNRKKQNYPLPPSPKSDPLIGHLRILPSVDEHVAYKKWGDELKSDIISLNIMGQIIIVLNSAEAANEILGRRAAIYSDRPQLQMVRNENLTGWGKNTAFLPYGERWRKQRRMTHEVLHKKASEEFWPAVTRQSRLALQRLLDRPQAYSDEFKSMTACTILWSAYGYEAASSEEELVKIVEAANKGLCQAALAGNFFVNVIPWLQYVPSWFPGAAWKRQAHKWRAEKDRMLHVPYNWTRDQMAAGTAAPSMLKNLLSNLPGQTICRSDIMEEEDRIKWTTGTMFSAGSDTSVAVLLVFVLAMTLHPEAQSKAQAELDSVLDGSRLPELTDRHDLPYINCLIKEVLRWRSIAPLAIPHRCTQDDHYKGYRIPEGAMVIGNVWAMSNDPKVYHEPDVFNPGRFHDPLTPDALLFGFGRRNCPGIHLAEAMLFSVISTMLTVFDIQPVRDSLGNPVLPSAKMGPNMLVNHPAPFDCKITIRSEKYEHLLREWSDL